MLYYGDNLQVLRRALADDSVDLCYVDPPFHSRRNYAQLYNGTGAESPVRAPAFVDTWRWDARASAEYDEILAGAGGRYTRQSAALIHGLAAVLSRESLLAYLVAMTARLNEVHRVLATTGSFYLHCDPTAGHYLKLVCDAIFLPCGGAFRNEIAWCYSGGGIPRRDFPRKHDTILRYTKSDDYVFLPEYRPYTPGTLQRGRTAIKGKYFEAGLREAGTPVPDWWDDVAKLTSPNDRERLGYPTQKSEALLRRIVTTSSREGDLVLDAFCGCGTTLAVAAALGRRWIGIDLAYQALALARRRLAPHAREALAVDGVPCDLEAARALARRRDERLRGEFTKWALLTYAADAALVARRDGAPAGIDGTSAFPTGPHGLGRAVFRVSARSANPVLVAALDEARRRAEAALAVLIVLDPPSRAAVQAARACGTVGEAHARAAVERLRIVSVEEILAGARFAGPTAAEPASAAQLDGRRKPVLP